MIASLIALGIAGGALQQQSTAEGLRSEIEGLRAPKVAWRQVPWKSCLLEGLQEARQTKRPLILWVFIDRPVDDGRC